MLKKVESMSLFLRIQVGAETKDVAVLQPGKLLTIGRILENDVAVEDDNLISSRHATLLQNGDVCELKDLQSTNGTFINDEQVSEAKLQHGDRFRCGQTEFQIDWHTLPQPAASDAPEAASAAPEISGTVVEISGETAVEPADEDPCHSELELLEGYHSDNAIEVIEKFAIAKKLPLSVLEGETTCQFAQRLLDHEDAVGALQFISCALPRMLCVRWAAICLSSVRQSDSFSVELLECVNAWLGDPSDSNRRAGHAVVEENQLESPAALLATAVFHAHGSSTPPEAPYVASPYDLSATLVFAALTIASADAIPDDVVSMRRQFVEIADEVATGKSAEVVA